MPQIGWIELLLIIIVAVLVIGPKDFPIVIKKVGSWVGSVKRYFSDVQKNVNEITSLEDSSDKKYKNKIGESFNEDLVFIYPNENNELISEIELNPLSTGFTWLQNKLKGNEFVYIKMRVLVNYNNMKFPLSIKKKLKYNDSALD